MNYIDLQSEFESQHQPDQQHLQLWVDAALKDIDRDAEIVIRIVDEQESAELNEQYRHKSGPTNILSFPVEIPEGIELDLLGDLVVCAPLLQKEAQEQDKPLAHHWAHIIVHGVLHLLGYDHVDDQQAEWMESQEIAILNTLNIPNPYIEVSNQ